MRNHKRNVIVLNGIMLSIFMGLAINDFFYEPVSINWVSWLAIYLILNIYTSIGLRIKNVSYDSSSVYYSRKGYEVQIPFEDIKSVEIKTVTGIYNIKLFEPTQNVKEILFKTSIWYPFNFTRQDEKVNELRDKIDKYKSKKIERNLGKLPSCKI